MANSFLGERDGWTAPDRKDIRYLTDKVPTPEGRNLSHVACSFFFQN